MENLKPCPFCGGKGKVKAAKQDYVGFTIWCECEKCCAQSGGYCPDIKDEDSYLSSDIGWRVFLTREEAEAKLKEIEESL